jgi:FlaG/FlaF family flagellin (archaellin)
VLSTAGDYYTGASSTLSVTIGEPVVETYTSGSVILSTGFQQSDLMKQLMLTLFLEGLWNGTGLNKAQNEAGDQYSGNTADKINIELHHATNYGTVVYSATGINLSTSGQAAVSVPGTNSGSYYLAVKHRNSIETVSALPLAFSGTSISYNFTDNASKAYGNNMKPLDGIYVIYSGDVNQNGIINQSDIDDIAASGLSFSEGYVLNDLNGDGTVDALDLILIDNNAALFISTVLP